MECEENAAWKGGTRENYGGIEQGDCLKRGRRENAKQEAGERMVKVRKNVKLWECRRRENAGS